MLMLPNKNAYKKITIRLKAKRKTKKNKRPSPVAVSMVVFFPKSHIFNMAMKTASAFNSNTPHFVRQHTLPSTEKNRIHVFCVAVCYSNSNSHSPSNGSWF